jgi:hypothetical protein
MIFEIDGIRLPEAGKTAPPASSGRGLARRPGLLGSRRRYMEDKDGQSGCCSRGGKKLCDSHVRL